MKAKLAFIAGLGAGYVLGTRAGRGSYESIKRSVKSSMNSLWHTEAVQETVSAVASTVKDEAADVAEQLGRRVKSAVPHGRPGHGRPADVISDPALNDEEGQDWTAEGGAGPAGPATPSH